MATSFRTGRFGKMTIAGTAIPVTKWSFKLDKSLQETTSTSSYDAGTTQTWQEQLPGVLKGEGSIDFNWDANSTSSAIIAKLKLDAAVAIVLQVDQSTTYASFNADLSDVDMNLEVDGKVSGTANFKSNGVVTMP
jgi:hypothetical protein